MIIAATGHRPQHAALPHLPAFSTEQEAKMLQVAKYFLSGFINVDIVITGGALGWDTNVARAAHALGLPFAVYAPFKGQESRWSEDCQRRYKIMLTHAAEVKYISNGGYSPHRMFERNKIMIYDCSTLIALWNPEKQSGGTFDAIQYARRIGKEYLNTWPNYRE